MGLKSGMLGCAAGAVSWLGLGLGPADEVVDAVLAGAGAGAVRTAASLAFIAEMRFWSGLICFAALMPD